MKKRNLNIFLVIIGIVALVVSCVIVANRKNEYKEEMNLIIILYIENI